MDETETRITYTPKFGGPVDIGVIGPGYKALDKAAFATLSPSDRLRAYLQMVYPEARHLTTLSRVSDLHYKSVPTVLRPSIAKGTITVSKRGWYRATVSTLTQQTQAQPPPAEHAEVLSWVQAKLSMRNEE